MAHTAWELYKIDDRIRTVVDTCVNAETGEVSEEISDYLEKLECDREEVTEGIALQIREMNAQAEAIDSEAKKLQARAKALKGQADSLTSKLSLFVGEGNKVKTPRVSVYWSGSSAIAIKDEGKLPMWSLVTSSKPNKKVLKEVLTGGESDRMKDLEGNVSIKKNRYMVVK